jgi:hypothetical protein
MNADTERKVKEIESQRYYVQGQTLGEGGWGAVNAFAKTWATYHLYGAGEFGPISTIKAESNTMAFQAFRSLFDLHKIELWEIVREERTYTTVFKLGGEVAQS